MHCTPLRSSNPFSLLQSLDPSPPNLMDGTFVQCIPLEMGARGESSGLVRKAHRSTDQHCDPRRSYNHTPRPNGYHKPRLPETRPPNNSFHQNRGSNCFPSAPKPPRFQNQPADCRLASIGFCSPPPGPGPGVIDPCSTVTPTCLENRSLDLQLKQEVFRALRKQPSATCADIFPHPMCNPNPSLQPPPLRPNPPRIEQDDIPTSTPTERTATPKQPPPKAEAVSRCPTNEIVPSQWVKVNLPRPPGLAKPNSCRASRNPPSAKPANAERFPSYPLNDSGFEGHNGPVVASRVFTPPPPGITPRAKLPRRKDIPDSAFECHNGAVATSRVFTPPPPGITPRTKLPRRKEIPRSPSTTSSSLSEDLSGDSSVVFSSDTTFTSVDTNISDKGAQAPKTSRSVCQKYMKGLPCYWYPCRYLHPGRPDQSDNTARQPIRQIPTLSDDAPKLSPQPAPVPPHLSGTLKTSAYVGGPQSGSMPQKHDPPSVNAELLPRPEPLYTTTISDHIKVRFGGGFEVREVVTGFESRWVHLGNIAGSVTLATLNELLGRYKVDELNLPESLSGKSVTAKVQFASPADAIKAVTDLNGIELADRTISAKSCINNSRSGSTVLKDTDVQLVWECPSRVGYAGYDTLKEAKAAMDSINGNPCEYLLVTAQLYEGLPCIGAYNVIFKQIPAGMTEQSLRKFAKTKSVMLGRPNYQSLDKAISSIRSRLEEYGTVTGFDVIPPPFRDGLVKAWVHFTSPVEARAAQADFDHRRPKAIGHTTLTCRHIVSVSHTLSSAAYKMMREDVGWLRDSWYRRYGPSVSIREKTKENPDDESPVHIRISSDHPEMLSALKYEFEQLLRGETIVLENKPLWDDFFVVDAGRTFVAQMQTQHPGIKIQVQANRRVITLFGPIVIRQHARAEIVRKISELKAQQVWNIPLSGRLIAIFVSAELSNLQELLGPENCMLNLLDRMLVIRGNDVAFRIACSAVEVAQSRQGVEVSRSDAICPVCFGEVIVPVTLACGHRWCRACLTGYLTSAVENKIFPLRCLGGDATCTQCIPLGLSRKVLSTADFNAVLEAAFWVYVHSRPDEFYHCPTPDCTQVYRSAPPNAVLQCPSCLARICPTCHIEYHDGLTCEERDVADDKLFGEWTSNHDVKQCPGCKAPIERSEGCNHMTCTRCQTHICWECLATFPKGQGIYEHMRTQHGGIGL